MLGSLRAADSSSMNPSDAWSKRYEHIDIAENSRPALASRNQGWSEKLMALVWKVK